MGRQDGFALYEDFHDIYDHCNPYPWPHPWLLNIGQTIRRLRSARMQIVTQTLPRAYRNIR